MSNSKWTLLIGIGVVLYAIPLVILFLNIDKPFTGKWWWYTMILIYAACVKTILKKYQKNFPKIDSGSTDIVTLAIM
jgi:hypothetical protein